MRNLSSNWGRFITTSTTGRTTSAKHEIGMVEKMSFARDTRLSLWRKSNNLSLSMSFQISVGWGMSRMKWITSQSPSKYLHCRMLLGEGFSSSSPSELECWKGEEHGRGKKCVNTSWNRQTNIVFIREFHFKILSRSTIYSALWWMGFSACRLLMLTRGAQRVLDRKGWTVLTHTMWWRWRVEEKIQQTMYDGAKKKLNSLFDSTVVDE